MIQNNQFIEDYKKQILDRVLQDIKKDKNDGVWKKVSDDAQEKENPRHLPRAL